MGVLRWLLWPRRKKEPEDEPEERPRKHRKGAHPDVYRIEVDSEARHLRGDPPSFSFWSSSRIILILSFLLWWIQPAGPMIAGYVGGRRAGSPWKAVVAALLPVFVILIANYAYAHNVAARQIDFVASLPLVVGDGAASILPFLAPYRDFLVAYMQGFVEALRTTFGMGTNGYLMVIIFAYIGGLIAEQTRRELSYRQGTSLGVNLLQPFFHGKPAEAEEEFEEDEEPVHRRSRRPVRAAKADHARGRRSRHGRPDRFEEFRKVPAETLEGHAGRRAIHARARDEDEEPEEEPEERTPRPSRAHAESRHLRTRDEDEESEPEPKPVREKRPVRARSAEEERAIQRFVERALKNYDHSHL